MNKLGKCISTLALCGTLATSAIADNGKNNIQSLGETILTKISNIINGKKPFITKDFNFLNEETQCNNDWINDIFTNNNYIKDNVEDKVIIHEVIKGDNLSKISKKYGVSIENLISLNGLKLDTQFNQICNNTGKKHKKGLWCSAPENTIIPGNEIRIGASNDSGVVYDGNTLTINKKVIEDVGEISFKLITQNQVPVAVQQAVKQAVEPMGENDKSAVIIDESGSMSDNRETVSKWTSGSLQDEAFYTYCQNVSGKLEASDIDNNNKNSNCDGSTENINNAISKSIEDGNTRIIVVTDEQGDDWENKVKVPVGTKITTFLINEGISCNDTKYGEVGSCLDLKVQ